MDAECLDYLMDMGPTTAGKLAEMTGLTHGAISNVIDRLEKVGFVKRQSDPKDRRKVIVVVVQEKIKVVAEVYRPTVMKIYGLYASYPGDELRFLLRFYCDLSRAVCLVWAMKNINDSIGVWEADKAKFEQDLATWRAAMPQEEFVKAVELGRAVTVKQA